jgi:hypothetical protein
MSELRTSLEYAGEQTDAFKLYACSPPTHLNTSSTALVKSPEGVQDQWLMTKGDNNPQDDTSLYRGLRFLRRSNM